MSFGEFAAVKEAMERETKQLWSIARWQEWHRALTPNGYRQGRVPGSPMKMYRFPWEDAPEEGRMTREDCHIDPETQAWLEERYSKYMERKNKILNNGQDR